MPEDKQTINNPPPQDGGSAGWIVAVMILVIVVLFLIFGLPLLRGSSVDINIPENINVDADNVNGGSDTGQ